MIQGAASHHQRQWDDLPVEMHRQILSHLDGASLGRMAQVNRECYALARDDRTWQKAYEQQVLAGKFPLIPHIAKLKAKRCYAFSYLHRRVAECQDRQTELKMKAHSVIGPLRLCGKVVTESVRLPSSLASKAMKGAALVGSSFVGATTLVVLAPTAVINPVFPLIGGVIALQISLCSSIVVALTAGAPAAVANFVDRGIVTPAFDALEDILVDQGAMGDVNAPPEEVFQECDQFAAQIIWV